jgi:(p)ppGpp synthase/HD superfamily hydrolase
MDDLIKRAKQFAIKAHGDQKYGKLPYSKHLEDVYAVAARYSLPQSVQVAAWLHDTVEDTSVSITTVKEEFGDEVALLVYAVTDEAGQNRKQRHAKTYPKIVAAGRDAIALKLSDNIANIENCIATNSSLFYMYLREYKGFKRALRRDGEHESMWKHLDKLMRHRKLKRGKK